MLRPERPPHPDNASSGVADETAPDVPRPEPPVPSRSPPAPSQPAPVEPPHESEPAASDPAHPITPEHQRLFAHRRLGFAMDDAADADNAPALRELLAQYHREFPGDEVQAEAAYRLILDCLEHPGAETRGAAERWLEQNNGSVVKRSIVRHCIEESSLR